MNHRPAVIRALSAFLGETRGSGDHVPPRFLSLLSRELRRDEAAAQLPTLEAGERRLARGLCPACGGEAAAEWCPVCNLRPGELTADTLRIRFHLWIQQEAA